MQSETENLKKKRGKRVTSQQTEVILNYMEENRTLLSGKCHPLDTKELERLWDELVNCLNNIELGARKDKEQWKRHFIEWKSKVKKKARESKAILQKTGGGGQYMQDLTDYENRLMGLIGWVSVSGCKELPQEIYPTVEENVKEAMIVDNIEIYDISNTEGDLASHEVQNTIHHDYAQADYVDTPVKHTSNKTTKREYKSQKDLLQQTVGMYSESATKLSEAISSLSRSISEVAKSLSDIAAAIAKE